MWEPYVRDFLDLLFATGLTPTLVTTLGQFSAKLTGLTSGIRDRLLETIHLVLAKRPYRCAPPSPRSPPPSLPPGARRAPHTKRFSLADFVARKTADIITILLLESEFQTTRL